MQPELSALGLRHKEGWFMTSALGFGRNDPLAALQLADNEPYPHRHRYRYRYRCRRKRKYENMFLVSGRP